MPIRPLELVRIVDWENSNAPADVVTDGLFRKFGGVTCAILPIEGRIKYVLVGGVDINNPKTLSPKKINQQVARRLAKLRPVSTLFTLDIWRDVAFIRYSTDIASLQDILAVRDSWQIKARHVHVLVADILSGISALHNVNLQKSSFSVNDILLVRCRDSFYFQIGKAERVLRTALLTIKAGLEYCTCFEGKEPTDEKELQSFRNMLEFIHGRTEVDGSNLIPVLTTTLAAPRVFRSEVLAAANEKLLAAGEKVVEEDEKQSIWQSLRMELEVYIHAERILGTTFGGTIGPK